MVKVSFIDGIDGPIRQIDVSKCRHVIMVPEHYRTDGSCKCNDPNDTIMREWGYRWSKQTKRWE